MNPPENFSIVDAVAAGQLFQLERMRRSVLLGISIPRHETETNSVRKEDIPPPLFYRVLALNIMNVVVDSKIQD